MNDIVMGFSAGVMLSAATAGLLASAFSPQIESIALAISGAIFGAILISLLDRFIPHLHRIAGIDFESHRSNGSISKSLLFVAALAIHKIPEGLAVGVSFGTGDIGDVLTISLAISLQNIPEAFVIVAPLFAIGVKSPRIIVISLVIALVSIVSVLAGYALVSVFAGALPFLLAAAGGAMLYVISDEIIPESHAHGFEKPATFALIIGFLLVLALQNIFG
ncbi:MAG: ZIP family metal transporter [Kiritimatiellae bacterium]|nr:ZIP family metal transporter [Kiritimatiellia bacterium]